jgi:hypothetical protein
VRPVAARACWAGTTPSRATRRRTTSYRHVKLHLKHHRGCWPLRRVRGLRGAAQHGGGHLRDLRQHGQWPVSREFAASTQDGNSGVETFTGYGKSANAVAESFNSPTATGPTRSRASGFVNYGDKANSANERHVRVVRRHRERVAEHVSVLHVRQQLRRRRVQEVPGQRQRRGRQLHVVREQRQRHGRGVRQLRQVGEPRERGVQGVWTGGSTPNTASGSRTTPGTTTASRPTPMRASSSRCTRTCAQLFSLPDQQPLAIIIL